MFGVGTCFLGSPEADGPLFTQDPARANGAEKAKAPERSLRLHGPDAPNTKQSLKAALLAGVGWLRLKAPCMGAGIRWTAGARA